MSRSSSAVAAILCCVLPLADKTQTTMSRGVATANRGSTPRQPGINKVNHDVYTGYKSILFGALRWTSRATYDFLHREIPVRL